MCLTVQDAVLVSSLSIQPAQRAAAKTQNGAPRAKGDWRFTLNPTPQTNWGDVLLVLLLSVYVSVSKNSFFCASNPVRGESGCKGTANSNTRQIFKRLFSNIFHKHTSYLTYIKQNPKTETLWGRLRVVKATNADRGKRSTRHPTRQVEPRTCRRTIYILMYARVRWIGKKRLVLKTRLQTTQLLCLHLQTRHRFGLRTHLHTCPSPLDALSSPLSAKVICGTNPISGLEPHLA